MESEKQAASAENFLLYAGISVMVLGCVILASFLSTTEDNILSSVRTKWKSKKNEVPEEEVKPSE